MSGLYLVPMATNTPRLQDLMTGSLDEIQEGLKRFDWIVINTSAGKDSQTMLDYVVSLCDLAGVPRRKIIAVHCDLGRVEWEGTPDLAARQVAQYEGVRFVKVQRDGTIRRDGKRLGDLLDQVIERWEANSAKGKDHSPWPTVSNRWCTSDQKTGQVLKLFTQLVAEASVPWRQVRILNCLGLRAEESDKRANMPVFAGDVAHSNNKRQVFDWLPIKYWTTEQVWASIRHTGIEHHWAYDIGMERLSCCFCVLASPEDWKVALPYNRKLAEQYAEVERVTGHAMVERKNGTKVSMQDILDAADRAAQVAA